MNHTKTVIKRLLSFSSALCLGLSSLSACSTEETINTATRAAISATSALIQAENISAQLESELEPQLRAEVLKEFKVYTHSSELLAYVRSVGQNLAEKASRNEELNYQFDILENEEVNAFTIPGGSIFVTTGLLKALEDEAELAAVLGHEIAHNEARHPQEALRSALVAEGLVKSTVPENKAILRSLASLTFELVIKGFNRSQEEEADQLGTILAAALSYDERAMVDFLKLLSENTAELPTPLQLFLTHPAPNERIQKLEAFFQEAELNVKNPVRDRDQYQVMTQVLKP